MVKGAAPPERPTSVPGRRPASGPRDAPRTRAPPGGRGDFASLPRTEGEVGTFKDNKAAPIHRWFQYPAGFSYRAVEHALDLERTSEGATVYDPFAGTGTTLVVCKGRGIASLGVEAHPLVARIARTKVSWDVDLEQARSERVRFLHDVRRGGGKHPPLREMPELVHKCYSAPNLRKLLRLRTRLAEVPEELRDLFEVALVGTLRSASAAATGWPYIAPKKRIAEKDAILTFESLLDRCLRDLEGTPVDRRQVDSQVLEGDARHPPVAARSVDLAFTSPPYLNNYDYADRLRLETYFLGMAGSWADISERFRKKLVVSATTQVLRQDGAPEDLVTRAVGPVAPAVAEALAEKVRALSRLRRERTGQKSYDLMVARYFVDMTQALEATRRTLRPGSRFVLILGDSAPYGVPIPTEQYLGEIGVGLGFDSFKVVPLRARGGKWRSNPQRHHVPLKESWLLLQN